MRTEKADDGVKHIYLEQSDCIDPAAAEKKLGQWLEEEDSDLIVDFDCNIYAPPDVYGNRRLILIFRKGVFSKKETHDAYLGLKKAAGRSENRGIAAGPREIGSNATRDWYVDPKTGKMTGQVYLKSTGEVSDTRYANPAYSGLAGYFDRYVRIPYCRRTSFTRDNVKDWEKAIPFLQSLSEQFRILYPERWKNQKEWVDKTSPDFIIPDTVFTTVTVNKNFRTAGHRDAGDLKEGFGNLTVATNGVDYKGGYTIMPRYRVGADVREGDVLLFDVHEIHGNTPLIGDETKFERISFVCYYRENMFECGDQTYEEARFNFVESRRMNKDHPGHKEHPRESWNGISRGMWHSDEWFEYLMNNGLIEYAQKEFPEKFLEGQDNLNQLFE